MYRPSSRFDMFHDLRLHVYNRHTHINLYPIFTNCITKHYKKLGRLGAPQPDCTVSSIHVNERR